MNEPPNRPERKRPAQGVLIRADQPTVVFVTFCTAGRAKVLATPQMHRVISDVLRQADRWRVGRYVIMPDHVHLFATPADLTVSLDAWVRYCKSMITRSVVEERFGWQAGHWDTRMRNASQYESKWEYVRHNAVRHGLVVRAEDWAYQGSIFDLAW